MKKLSLATIIFFVICGGCERELTSADKKEVVDFIQMKLSNNESEFSQIAQFLDSFKTDKKNIHLYKYAGKTHVDATYTDHEHPAKVLYEGIIPENIPMAMDKAGIRAIFIDSSANHHSMSFVRGFSRDSRIYLLHIRKQPIYRNQDDLIANFNGTSSNWLYLVDSTWAIRAEK